MPPPTLPLSTAATGAATVHTAAQSLAATLAPLVTSAVAASSAAGSVATSAMAALFNSTSTSPMPDAISGSFPGNHSHLGNSSLVNASNSQNFNEGGPDLKLLGLVTLVALPALAAILFRYWYLEKDVAVRPTDDGPAGNPFGASASSATSARTPFGVSHV